MGPGPALQRAVGYEFETGWKVWDQTPVRICQMSGGKSSGKPAPQPRPLTKKEVVHEDPGFRVEADEAEGGLAELEFVVHPPIEASAAGLDTLFERMVAVTLIGAELLRAAQNSGGDSFNLRQALGGSGQEKFIIRPIDKDLSAGPQVTSGISLGKVGRIGTDVGESMPRALQTSERVAAGLGGALNDVSPLLPEALQPMSAELRGLLTVIAPYLWSGERAVLYPKQTSDSLLLARTDFATLFRMLPDGERAYLKKHPDRFTELAMKAADVEGDDRPVIGRVWTDEKMTEARPLGPSRKEWLWYITHGYDLLSSRHYRDLREHYAREDPERGTLASELESLGELGSKTEPVGSDAREGGIFEFRGAAVSRAKLPLMEWTPFATQMMKYLTALEDAP